MFAEVKLTVERGLHEGKVFTFRDRTVGSVGRAEDCLLRLPSGIAHRDVSRHHCLLDISPPEIWVRDLGSKNGTYVNGQKIGQREWGVLPEACSAFEMPECCLEDGDALRVGATIFRVHITGAEGDAGEGQRSSKGNGVLVG
jgi:pSer/pThr/pTyr-binding forkhead associated (FHA) protein